MSLCQQPSCPQILPPVNCKVQGVTLEDLSVWISQARRMKEKKTERTDTKSSSFPGDLYIFTGEFTGGTHLIWYLLPLTLSQAFTSYLVRRLNSLPLQRKLYQQMFMEGAASPHLAGLMEFRWQQRTTYGKPIRGCIRNNLLSPESALYFIVLDITCTQALDSVWVRLD